MAYDMIRLAFDRLRTPRTPSTKETLPLSDRQPAAWNFATEHQSLLDTGDVLRFQDYQSQLHAEQRRQGVPWLVTDLITAGSPIAHADDLWGSKVASFELRAQENEYPSCPPLGETQHSEVRRIKTNKPAIIGGEGRIAFYRKDEKGPLVAHEASPFASTRWTNLYMPVKPWLGGDPVGGKVAVSMGPGVRDIAVRPSTRRPWALAVPVAAHTWYWRRDAGVTDQDDKRDASLPDSVRQMGQVISLKHRRPGPYQPPVNSVGDTPVSRTGPSTN